MSYLPVFSGSLSCLRQVKKMSEHNRKSAELWELFSDNVSLVDENKFVLPSREVTFLTVIRSSSTNKIITYGHNSACSVSSRVPVDDVNSTFLEMCIKNAFTAFTNSVLGPKELLVIHSEPIMMGVIIHGSRLYVYMNVVMSDSLSMKIDTGYVRLSTGARICPIQDFNPIKGSIEDKIYDSLIIVGGTKDA